MASGGQSSEASASVQEYSGLISLKIGCFDLLPVQGTRKSLLQHHSSKASILQCSAFFMVQFSQPYMKDHNLAIQTCVSKAMSLFFNTLSRFVKAFLLRSNRLLIPRLQLPSAVISEPKKRKSVTVSIFSPSICHEVIGLDAMILGFLLLLFSFRQAFSLFSSSRGSLVPLSFLPLEWYQPHTGEGSGNPLQYSCLEDPVDRGAWWAAVHRVAQSRTRLKSISMQACMHWRMKWEPTPIFLPGESQGQRSLEVCCP